MTDGGNRSLGILSGAELAIPGIAKARDDEANFIQVGVEPSQVNGHFGVIAMQTFYALGRRDKAYIPYLPDTPGFKEVTCGGCRPSGSQHGI
jgi:hypothetical protein